jgi:putative transcriptional regulator
MKTFSRLPETILSAVTLVAIAAFFSLLWNPPARGAEPAETLVLVARPGLVDPLYGQSILVAREIPDGRHVGFILNRPTEMTMTEAFPGHEASKTVTEPLYLGGPADLNAVFALVHRHTAPKDGILALTDDLYLAISAAAVDEAMTVSGNEQSRFFAGSVLWRPGELDEEIRRGAWYVMEPTAEIVLPKRTTGLWERLVRQAQMLAEAI